MTIKQLGGVFGRNPTFNDVTIEGELTFDGDIDVNSDLKVNGDIEASRLGINTDPSHDIHIKNATAAQIKMEDTGSATAHSIIADGVGLSLRADSAYNDVINVLGGAAHQIVFRTNGADAFIVDAAGNIAFTSGKGIDFSATADGPGTVESELFNDYEEGYYTATTTPGSGSLTTSYDRLNYTKVGRSCTVSGEIVVSSVSTPGSNLTVSLPFAAASGSERSQRTHFWVFLGALTGSPTGVASGYIGTAGGTDFEIVIYDDFAAVSNTASFLQVGSTIRVGFTYQTA